MRNHQGFKKKVILELSRGMGRTSQAELDVGSRDQSKPMEQMLVEENENEAALKSTSLANRLLELKSVSMADRRPSSYPKEDQDGKAHFLSVTLDITLSNRTFCDGGYVLAVVQLMASSWNC